MTTALQSIVSFYFRSTMAEIAPRRRHHRSRLAVARYAAVVVAGADNVNCFESDRNCRLRTECQASAITSEC